jgi:hypothetical protein
LNARINHFPGACPFSALVAHEETGAVYAHPPSNSFTLLHLYCIQFTTIMLRMFCLTHQRPTPQVRWRRICPHDTRSCSQSSWTLRAAASSTRRSIFWDGCPEILPLTTDLKSYTTELFASQVAQGTPPVNQNKDRSVPFRSLITKGYRVILSLNVLEFAERGSTMRDQWSLNFF